ncbi:MAG: hypothetical protein AAF502_17615 [Bacteroidota bacterium]
MNFLKIIFIIGLLSFSTACKKNDCVIPECRITLGNGSAVTVTNNVSGGQGTQITPDIIDPSSITSSSATIKFNVHRIGVCHVVIGYGHTWSSTNGTPRIGTDDFSDYGSNVNFGDEVLTSMNNLTSNTKYWVRSWIAIEVQDCTIERIIYYNDDVSDFTTL